MKAQWLRAGLLLLATGHALSPADNVANMVTLGSPFSSRSFFSLLAVRAGAGEGHEPEMAESGADEIPVSAGRALWRRRGG